MAQTVVRRAKQRRSELMLTGFVEVQIQEMSGRRSWMRRRGRGPMRRGRRRTRAMEAWPMGVEGASLILHWGEDRQQYSIPT